MSKTAILCARVSTDAQAEHGRSLQTQLEAERQYATAHGFEIVAEITDDISGAVPIRQRPGGARLYSYIDGHKCAAVIFYTVDRITRDEDLIEINVIRRDIRNAGMELHYAADGGQADLSTMGGMIDTLKAAIAAEERKKIAERNTRGRRAKAQAGKWVGHGDPPFGYRRVGWGRDARLEIDEAEAALVRRIFALCVGTHLRPSMSTRGIVATLNDEQIPSPSGKVWRHGTVALILRAEIYVGILRYRNVDELGFAPELRIVEDDTFQEAARQLRVNTERAARNRKRDYLLTGHIRCVCGRAMNGITNSTHGTMYYRCGNRMEPKQVRFCFESQVRGEQIDRLAWSWLVQLMTDETYLTQALDVYATRQSSQVQDVTDDLSRVEGEIQRTQRRLERLTDELTEAEGSVAEVLRSKQRTVGIRLDALKREQQQLAAEVGRTVLTKDRQRAIVHSLSQYREQIEAIAPDDIEAKKYILDSFELQCRVIRDADGGRSVMLSCGVADHSERLIVHSDSRNAGHGRAR